MPAFLVLSVPNQIANLLAIIQEPAMLSLSCLTGSSLIEKWCAFLNPTLHCHHCDPLLTITQTIADYLPMLWCSHNVASSHECMVIRFLHLHSLLLVPKTFTSSGDV